MFRNTNYNKKVILKRKDEEEKNSNYTKIYDLSELDKIPNIDTEEKYNLLITIKKLLLCTNKYIDICNRKEMLQYCLASFVIYIIYILILSPLIKIYFLTEEQSNSLQYFNIFKKFWYYSLSQFIEISIRLLFNYYGKFKTTKILLYYARNELNKIKNDFKIDIDENFDLTISKSIDEVNNETNDKFFQYVICYPNVRYYEWNIKILNEKEKIICNLIKNNLQNSEDKFLLKYAFNTIIIFILYIAAFYFLTKANVKLFFIFMITLFIFTKIISVILSIDMKKYLILNEEIVNKYFITQGYFISFSTSVISIFKLNDNYINISNIDLNEAYKRLDKEFSLINDKLNIF